MTQDIPSKEDVMKEMLVDALLDDIRYHFGDELPKYWQTLMDELDYDRLSYEWYEFTHPQP